MNGVMSVMVSLKEREVGMERAVVLERAGRVGLPAAGDVWLPAAGWEGVPPVFVMEREERI